MWKGKKMSNEIQLESFPFDSMDVLNEESSQMEPDREYAAEVFRTYFKMFLGNGVYYGDYKNYKENSMKVTSAGGMNIKVATGAGMIEGANFENLQERVFSLNRPAAGNRVDRVVVQMNSSLEVRATKLLIKEGEGTTPATLQRDENIYEICLAEVTVKSTSNITQDDVSDKRLDKTLCGIVNSLITVDGAELYQQFQDYIDSVTENLVRKDQNSTITGKLIVQGGIEANVKGSLDGNAKTATTAGSCTGNAATATTATTAKSCTRQCSHSYKSYYGRILYW